MERIFKKFGVIIAEDGNTIYIHAITFFARILCNMAVKDHKFEKIDKSIFKLIKKN
jgi:hypothetical protein